jgi:hypothetical protein
VHHKLEELLDQYLKTTGLEKEPESPLFLAALGKTGKLSRRPLVSADAADRRCSWRTWRGFVIKASSCMQVIRG